MTPSRWVHFIGKLTRDLLVNGRFGGAIAVSVVASLRGASIVRVHDDGVFRRALNMVGVVQRTVEVTRIISVDIRRNFRSDFL